MTKEEALFEYLTAHYATELRSILADVAEHSFDEYRSITFNCEFGSITLSSNETKEPDKTFLPSNLDEAAEEILSEKYPLLHNGSLLMEREMMELIKAGAEWMADQGASFNTKVGWIDGPTILDWPDDILDKFEMGDEVIVQIRKKAE